jgi:3-mercaptopyruvate sulfurtransferase SseA
MKNLSKLSLFSIQHFLEKKRLLPVQKKSKIRIIVNLVMVLFILSACQLKPTQVRQDYQPNLSSEKKDNLEISPETTSAEINHWNSVIQNIEQFKAPQITEKTLILDARTPFEFSISHVRGSINLRWDDFTIPEEKFKGVLVDDLYFHSRRFARMGISNKSQVVIIGNGAKGDGSDGRLAWTLKQMGIDSIQILTLDSVRLPMSAVPTDLKAEVPSWKPKEFISLKNEKSFLELRQSKNAEKAKWLVLDVRTEKEYLAKSKQNMELDLHWQRRCSDCEVINIPWKEFYNLNGSCNSNTLQHLALIQNKFQQNNLDKKIYIVVSSETGVPSGIAAFCLQAVPKEKNWIYWDVFMFEGGTKSLQ